MMVVFWANQMWYVIHDDLTKWRVWLMCQELKGIEIVPYWRATNEVWFEFILIPFESNGNYVLGTEKHENFPSLGG